MSDSLEKLVKEIDALTYNARSVINALTRSVLANSSTNGFTIKRAGIEIKLSRPLIYRLSRFYEEWANNDYFVQDPDNVISTNKRDFDTILSDHDLIPVRDETGAEVINQPTTAALTIHSKILFLNSDNVSRNEDTPDNISFWHGLIKSANNPKLITNSAPIPLNLRTPIFDENLSTARFLSSESYLFPYAYFALDTLGYSGDATDHQLGGLSWTIVADQSIKLLSNNISVGGVNPNAPLKTLANRVGNFGFAWGYDTHARGDFSTAGGVSTFAVQESTVAIGKNSIASEQSAVVIGNSLSAAGNLSAAVGGGYNKAVGDYSGVFGGYGNVSGDEVFSWYLDPTTATTPDGCFVDLANCTAVLQPGSTTIFLNKNILVIPGNVVDRFNVFDSIKIFDFTVAVGSSTNNQFYYTEGNAFPAIYQQVSGISFDSENNVTKITLSSDIPYANIDGGSVSVIYRNNGLTEGEIQPGQYSFVTGLFNIASGFAQAVVGKYNKKVADAKFIVGTGAGDSSRKNSLVVTETSVSAFGIEGNGPFSDDSFMVFVDNQNAIVKAGLSKLMLDNFTLTLFQDSGAGSTASLVMTNGFVNLTSSNFMTLSSPGIQLQADSNISMSAIYGIDASCQYLFMNASSSMSFSADSFSIYSNQDLNLSSQILNISWSSAPIGAFDSPTLKLSGNAFGSLPTTDIQTSHILDTSNINASISYLFRTGFYAVNTMYNDFDAPVAIPLSTIGTEAGSDNYFLLNVSHKDPADSLNHYEAWQMIFGRRVGPPVSLGDIANRSLEANPSDRTTYGNIGVRRIFNGDDVPGGGGRYSDWRFLAWQDELATFQTQINTINSDWTFASVTAFFQTESNATYSTANSVGSYCRFKQIGRLTHLEGVITIDVVSGNGPFYIVMPVPGLAATSDTQLFYTGVYRYVFSGVLYTSPVYITWSAPNQIKIAMFRPGSSTNLGPTSVLPVTFVGDGTVTFSISYRGA